MSLSELQRFGTEMESNAELRERLGAAGTRDFDATLAAVRAEGFEIEKTDLEQASGKMSDDELDNVAGGGIWSSIRDGFNRFNGMVTVSTRGNSVTFSGHSF